MKVDELESRWAPFVYLTTVTKSPEAHKDGGVWTHTGPYVHFYRCARTWGHLALRQPSRQPHSRAEGGKEYNQTQTRKFNWLRNFELPLGAENEG